ncbi:MAG: fluoride efflux transporter CrcB [Flavobacteriales bacterium]|nr:fluoride efflux transporter CrcB [Flavobacteriales bacterium]
MINWIAIFIGGGIGSLCRYGISRFVMNFSQSVFPTATLIANLVSCIILGLTLAIFLPKMEGNEWLKPLIVIGFCGGFSTFSTFSLETLQLLKMGNIAFAGINIAVSILLCTGVLALIVKNG